MPVRAMRPCSYRGCSTLVRGSGPCPAHAHSYDRHRGSAASRGYGPRWRAYRKQYLAENPFCVPCSPRLTRATVVDHIEAVQGEDDPRFYDPENHQAMCASCHGRKTVRHDGGFGR